LFWSAGVAFLPLCILIDYGEFFISRISA
jgi:hypothetical protein